MDFNDLKKELLAERANRVPTFELGSTTYYLFVNNLMDMDRVQTIARSYAEAKLDKEELSGPRNENTWKALLGSAGGEKMQNLGFLGFSEPVTEYDLKVLKFSLELMRYFSPLVSIRTKNGDSPFSDQDIKEMYDIFSGMPSVFNDIDDKLKGQDDPNLQAASNGQDMSVEKAATQ